MHCLPMVQILHKRERKKIMLNHFFLVAGQVVTLFLLMGVGFGLAQLGKLTDEGISQMTTLVLYVVTPCLIIQAFSGQNAGGMAGRLCAFAGIYAVFVMLSVGASLLSVRKEPPARRNSLRFSMVYGNNGFMGIPLLLAVVGREAVVYGVVSIVVFNLLLWTHGVKTMGGRVTLVQALINPATVGLAAGLPLFLTGLQLPDMVGNAVGFLADLNTPLAMVIIGGQMAGADLKVCFTSVRLYRVAAFRLLIAPLLPLLLLPFFHPDPIFYYSAVILCGVPAAGVTGMLAERFGGDTAAAAQIVALTTLLSVITLPIMVVAARFLSGAV